MGNASLTTGKRPVIKKTVVWNIYRQVAPGAPAPAKSPPPWIQALSFFVPLSLPPFLRGAMENVAPTDNEASYSLVSIEQGAGRAGGRVVTAAAGRRLRPAAPGFES